MSDNTDSKKIWDFLMEKIQNPYGVAGLMGNLYAESGLRPNNLQNDFEKRLGYTDDQYTAAVDKGKYKNFSTDCAGYGIAQWTFRTRKQELLEFAKSRKKSIGDLQMQLDFLYKELSEKYGNILTKLEQAKDLQSASDEILLKFEKPFDTSAAVRNRRKEYGQKYLDEYYTGCTGNEKKPQSQPKSQSKILKADCADCFSKSIAGEYRVKSLLGVHVRVKADNKSPSLGIVPFNGAVNNYGYYTGEWLYVKTAKGVVGFCQKKFLRKKGNK